MKEKIGFHEVKITLIDKRGKSSLYKMKVNFKIQKAQATKVNEVKIIEEEKASTDSEVYAKITELTKYGNLTIEFTK